MRVVDVATALATRGYSGRGQLVFEMQPDSLTPWNDGCWLLEVDQEEARVSASQAAADVSLSSTALSALFCNHSSAQALANAGIVDASPKLVQQLDALFGTRYKPHCPDHY